MHFFISEPTRTRDCCAEENSENNGNVHVNSREPAGFSLSLVVIKAEWFSEGTVFLNYVFFCCLFLFFFCFFLTVVEPSRSQKCELAWPVAESGYLVSLLCKLKNSVECLKSSRVWFDQNISQQGNKSKNKNQNYDFNYKGWPESRLISSKPPKIHCLCLSYNFKFFNMHTPFLKVFFKHVILKCL